MRDSRDRLVPGIGWTPETCPPGTRCKHGWGDCMACGTREATDVIHSARTPDKRAARRLRRRGRS